jgi:hypothetical protein
MAPVALPSTHFNPLPAAGVEFGYNAPIRDLATLRLISAGKASLVRASASWNATENPLTGELALNPQLEEGLAECARLGLKPILVAAYGSPYSAVAKLTVTEDVPAGSLTIPCTGAPALQWPRHRVSIGKGLKLSQRASYSGTLVTAATSSSIEVASALIAPLTAGSILTLNLERYAPVNGTDPTQSSVQAYLRYVRFIAERIAAHGLEGYICLWNEPVWEFADWDALARAYDNQEALPPGVQRANGELTAILAGALAMAPLPTGVHWINGATDKAGGFACLFKQFPGVPNASNASGVREGIHTYRDNPEGHAWNNEYQLVNPFFDATSAFHFVGGKDAKAGFDIAPMATECGFSTTNDQQQATYLLRRALSHLAVGVVPVFFCADLNGGPYSVLKEDSTGKIITREGYLALQRLSELLASLGPNTTREAPSVVAVSGSPWPLMSCRFYGSLGATLFVWQMDWGTKTEAPWPTLSPPPAASVKLKIPLHRSLSAVTVRNGAPLPVVQGIVPVSNDVVAVTVR